MPSVQGGNNAKSVISKKAKSYGVDRKVLRQRVKEELTIDAEQGHVIYLDPAVKQEISECLQVEL